MCHCTVVEWMCAVVSLAVTKYLQYFVRVVVFVVKQKTAYEMRISDWSSDVCSSDLLSASLSRDPDIEVVGAASNAMEGRQLIKELDPDVITLDIEMPG